MAELNVTELDFDTIKNNLRTYLAAQPEFTDYDFTGSALNILLDVLAYNTHYNAVLANLQSNEMFIDTAIKRTSVVSLAKMLGYSPKSATSAKARVDLSVTRDVTVGPSLSITPSVKFNAAMNGTSYTFNVNESQTATVNSENKFVFTDVELIEGVYLSNSFLIGSDNLSGPLIIPNANVDTSTVEVTVQNSTSDLTSTTWSKTSSIVDVTNTSKLFWVEENNAGQYQVVFGDDNVGAKLIAGNIVTITYIASEGSAPNGTRVFTLVGDIDGEDQVDITILQPASGGSYRESIDSIRFNAPKYNANRNRAVTAEDYRTLIKQNFSKAREVTVWGGETNNPPIYGSVFISIDPVTDAVLTDADKDFIKETILRPRSVMSIKHEFVDPDYVYLGIEGVINYNPKLTALKASDISTIVSIGIEDYFDNELGTLDRTFFLSKLSERVKQVNTSIISSVFKLRLQKRIPIGVSTTSGYSASLNFLTAIDPETIRSSNFVTTISGLQYTGFLQDFSDDAIINDSGAGTIKFVDKNTNTPVATLGIVNYQTGIITLSNVGVTRYLGNVNEVYLSLRPQPLYQNIASSVVRTSDISTFAVAAQPSRSTILTLDDSVSNSEANISAGLVISSRPYTEV
jgi:hypothetical protein